MKSLQIKIVLLLLVYSPLLIAQHKLDIGLRTGLNISTTMANNKFSGYMPGGHLGASLKSSIDKKISIFSELLLSSRGHRYNYSEKSGLGGNNYVYYDIKELLVYLDLPILFNYKSTKGFYLEGGIQPSIFAVDLTFVNGNIVDSYFTNYVNPFDISPVAGVGYEWKKLSIGLRSMVSAIGIYQNSSNSYKTRNLSLMATLRYRVF